MHLKISFYLRIEEWMYVLQVYSVLDDHQSIELVLKAKDIFIKLNNTLILPQVEGRDVLDSRKSLFCSPTTLCFRFR